MTPQAIVIFSAGIMPSQDGGWHSTTYNERDTFGTLGGRDRIDAAVILSKKYPDAFLVTTSRRMNDEPPTQAEVYAHELKERGVAPERIIEEKKSINTKTAIEETYKFAQQKRWKYIILLSSEYHIPRIKAFYKQKKRDIKATMISSESILIEDDPTFTSSFEKIKKTDAYYARLVSEKKGIKAMTKGLYQATSNQDKKERLV